MEIRAERPEPCTTDLIQGFVAAPLDGRSSEFIRDDAPSLTFHSFEQPLHRWQ
jgi:hypothetical protein